MATKEFQQGVIIDSISRSTTDVTDTGKRTTLGQKSTDVVDTYKDRDAALLESSTSHLFTLSSRYRLS